MSETMSYLRKNQKMILAVTGVVCIITFTVGSFILQWVATSAQSAPGEVTVVSWKGGRINEKDMSNLMRAHYLATEATRNVAIMAAQKGAIPYGYGVDVDMQRGVRGIGIVSGRSEEDVVTVMVLANKAKSLGMSVSDEAVKQFLSRLAGAPNSGVTDGDIKKMLQDTLRDNMTLAQYFEQMKTELLAQNMIYLARTGISALTPSEAFSYFERLNRAAQIESFPVKVADFVDQVKSKPSDAQLRELYEEYKNTISQPSLPEPGFHVPSKVALEFVKVNFNKLVDEEKAKITEEAIKAEYEKRVAAGDFKAPSLPDLPEEKPATPKDDDAEKKPTEEKDPAAKPEEDAAKPDEAAKPDDTKSEKKDEEPKTEEAKPEEPKADDKKEEAPKEEAPKEEAPKEEAPKEEAPKEDEAKEKGAALPSGEVFVAVQDEAAPEAGEKKEEEPKTDEPKAEEPKAEEPKTEEAKPAEPPADDKKTEEKPAENEKKTDETAQPDAAAAPEVKIKPLAEVREQILLSLAREPAQKRMDAAFDIVRKAVIKHGRDTHAARHAHKQDDKKPAPEPFDLAKVAKEAGLEYGSIPLMDQFQLSEQELGQTSVRSAGGFGGSLPFVSSALDPRRNLYVPEQSFGDGKEFVSWLTEQKANYVPTFEEAKDKVKEAWFFREARKLASAEANKLAEEAAADKSLKDSFIDRTVTESGMFTWLTAGFTPFGFNQPRLSEVQGVEMAGMDFMRKVFSLNVGQAGVAPNQPETIFYVVRPVKFAPDEKVLREMFAGNGTAMNAQRVIMSVAPIAQAEREQIERQWFQDLSKEYNIKWSRDAHIDQGDM